MAGIWLHVHRPNSPLAFVIQLPSSYYLGGVPFIFGVFMPPAVHFVAPEQP